MERKEEELSPYWAEEDAVRCIDVECVATGFGHSDRAPAAVAVVDGRGNVLLHKYVKPEVAVVNYLTPLTGLKKGDLDDADPLETVLEQHVYPLLSPETVLVGQSPQSDVGWLRLVQGTHFSRLIDLADIFKVFNPKFHNYSYFSLDHEVCVLLPEVYKSRKSSDPHDPRRDALWSINLWQRYRADAAALAKARKLLLYRRPDPSWVKLQNYQYEGVCLAGFYAAKCICGQPQKN